MSWLLWCILVVVLIELVIQYCIIRAAYPVLFTSMPDRFNLLATLNQLPEADDSIEVNEVLFPAAGGLTLHGIIVKPKHRDPQGLILFCHPFKSTGEIALYQCRGLLKAGFAVFSFDFRNHGESDIDPQYHSVHWLSNHEISDIKAAIECIGKQPALSQLPLGLYGMSRGASAALAVAAQSSAIQFVACEGAFLNEELFLDHAIRWGERFLPRLFIKLVPTWEVIRAFQLMLWYSQDKQGCSYVKLKPYLRSLTNKDLLFIVGENDQSVAPTMTPLITKKIRNSRITACSLPHTIHNAGRFTQLQKYDAALIEFFTNMPLRLSQQQKNHLQNRISGEPDSEPVPSKNLAADPLSVITKHPA